MDQLQTIIKSLLTTQLPAVLTFISATLGIAAQLVISWHSTRISTKTEVQKSKLVCVKLFYIPLLKLLLVYRDNINLLKQLDSFNVFVSNSPELNLVSGNYDQVLSCIKQLSEINLDHYYPVGRKIHRETIAMLSYMATAQYILDQPPTERKSLYQGMGIAVDGYDVNELVRLIGKYISSFR